MFVQQFYTILCHIVVQYIVILYLTILYLYTHISAQPAKKSFLLFLYCVLTSKDRSNSSQKQPWCILIFAFIWHLLACSCTLFQTPGPLARWTQPSLSLISCRSLSNSFQLYPCFTATVICYKIQGQHLQRVSLTVGLPFKMSCEQSGGEEEGYEAENGLGKQSMKVQ